MKRLKLLSVLTILLLSNFFQNCIFEDEEDESKKDLVTQKGYWTTPCEGMNYGDCCRKKFGNDYYYSGIIGGGGTKTEIFCTNER